MSSKLTEITQFRIFQMYEVSLSLEIYILYIFAVKWRSIHVSFVDAALNECTTEEPSDLEI